MEPNTQAILTDLEKQLRGDAWPGKIVRLLRLLLEQRIPTAPDTPALVDATRAIANHLKHLAVTVEAANCPDNPANAPTVAILGTQLEKVVELPSRWGCVHMMGHQEHVGEFQQLPGGAVLVHGIKADVSRYYLTAERQGRHSIDWLTEAQWLTHVANIEKNHARELERELRRNKLPPGYEDYQRQLTDPPSGSERGSEGFVAPDGQVWGWWHSPLYARAAAWDHADGNDEDVDGYARFPRVSASGVDSTDLNDPRSPAAIERALADHGSKFAAEVLVSWQDDTDPGDDGRPLGDLTAAIVRLVQERIADYRETEQGDAFDSRFTGVEGTKQAVPSAQVLAADEVSRLSGAVIEGRTAKDIERATKHAIQVLTELRVDVIP